jgi:hypothetical protein
VSGALAEVSGALAEVSGALAEVSGALAEGARRGLLAGEAADPEGPNAPSLIVLDENWDVHSMTPGARELLADLPGGGELPASVLSAAGRALASRSRFSWRRGCRAGARTAAPGGARP